MTPASPSRSPASDRAHLERVGAQRARVLARAQRAIDRAVRLGVGWDDLIVDPGFGFTPDARFDQQGFRNMLALRAEIERKGDAPPERYVDLGYYERAMRKLRQ